MTRDQIIKTAVEQKSTPKYLFKYRACNTFTEKIITDNELWFSNPLIFNDPFDCNIPIDTSHTLDDIKNWLRKIAIYEKNINSLSKELKANPDLIQQSTKRAMEETGVCCFSSMHDNILQWSHYADYHKGICLEFDITESTETFITPIIVSYRKIMPHYNHLIHSERLIELLIQPKYFEWSYESEVRVVKTPVDIKNNKNNRSFKYNDKALKEIIFGTKCDDKTIKQYIALCQATNKKHVKFSKMELGNNTNYELIKKDL